MFASHREFKRKFTSRLELPVFINDELVTFGQTYAKENGYRIDEMGILALYSRIDMMQREDHAVTVAEVKEIMDEAISHSQKALPARSFVYADQTDNYKQRVLDILHKKCISCPKLFLFIAISSIIFLNIFDRR